MLAFLTDLIGVAGLFAGALYSVRVWAWATQATWLRADWTTPPAWVAWCHLLAREDEIEGMGGCTTMFRTARLETLIGRCEAAVRALDGRHRAAWSDRAYDRMRALEGRQDVLNARREALRDALAAA